MTSRQLYSQVSDGERTSEIAPAGMQPTAPTQVNLLTILWRRQNTVAIILVGCLIVAFIYLLKATPIYSSTSRICVEQNAPKILTADAEMIASEKSDSFLYTQAQIVSCMPVLTAAMETPGVSQASVFKDADNKLAYLRKQLVVDVGKKDDIISVTFSSPSPQEASLIVNSVVDNYVDYETKQNKSTAGEILKVLTTEKDKHEAILEQQEQALVDFKQANGDVFFQTEKGNIVMEDMETASNQLVQARLDEAAARSRYQTDDDTLYAHTQWIAAQAKVREFQEIYKQQQAKALALNSRMAQHQKLEDDIDRTTKIVDLLDSRIKELNVNEDAGPLNISILEVARPEEKPAFPRKTLTMALALLVGLILGTGGALLHEALDHRLRSADEVTELLGLPVLGIIPSIRDNDSVLGETLLTSAPNSEVSEAYRSFRTALQFGLPDRSAKMILITSPTPGDGKSTTASNLAVALAQADRKTLLIDADLRKPTQHKNFKLLGVKGISDVLVKGYPIDQAIQRTQIEGLDLLACGSIPSNPSEIINSHAFHSLLMQMEGKYDQIIVDSPPVLPVADARILGALCDITVLVLRSEKSTRRGSRHCCELLANVRAKVIGVVMNDVSRTRTNGYGYSYYSGYYSYYGNSESGSRHANNGKENPALANKTTDLVTRT